jgi:hypothetical protein
MVLLYEWSGVLHASFTDHHAALIVVCAMFVLRYVLQFTISEASYIWNQVCGKTL